MKVKVSGERVSVNLRGVDFRGVLPGGLERNKKQRRLP